MGAFGDVLLATSVIPWLTKKHPDSKISFFTKVPDILSNNPLLDTIYKDNCNLNEFDIIYDLDQSYELFPKQSILASYATVVKCSVEDLNIIYSISQSVQKQVNDLFLSRKISTGKVIALQAASNSWARNIRLHYLDALLKSLKEELDVTFLNLGTLDDPYLAEAIDLRGIGKIELSAGIIAKANAFMGIDSTLLHFAKALNKPVLTFFGPTDPSLRINETEKDLIISADCSCKFCLHEQKPPSFVSICKRDLFSIIVDSSNNLVLKAKDKQNLVIYDFLHQVFIKMSKWRDKGRNVPYCMKSIETIETFNKVRHWIKQLSA
jgi:ADP-heptose:LPS heptosyltransferase